jgi:pimeloyl-ACP methyl ester carboxylesterase
MTTQLLNRLLLSFCAVAALPSWAIGQTCRTYTLSPSQQSFPVPTTQRTILSGCTNGGDKVEDITHTWTWVGDLLGIAGRRAAKDRWPRDVVTVCDGKSLLQGTLSATELLYDQDGRFVSTAISSITVAGTRVHEVTTYDSPAAYQREVDTYEAFYDVTGGPRVDTVRFHTVIDNPSVPWNGGTCRYQWEYLGAGSSGLAPPGPPANFAGNAVGSTVTLSWLAPSTGGAPTGYFLDAGTRPGGSDIVASHSTGTGTTFTVADVPDGTYYLRVRAANPSGISAASNEAEVIVGGIPGPPRNLSGQMTGSTVTLAWNAPSTGRAPTSYVIEAGSRAGASDLASATVPGSTTSLQQDVPLGTYYVRVRAVNAAGASAPSNEIVLSSPPTLRLKWRSRTDPTNIYVRLGSPISADGVIEAIAHPPGGTYNWTIASTSVGELLSLDNLAAVRGRSRGTTDVDVTYTTPAGGTLSASIRIQVFYPIVLVHGMNSSAATWTELITVLTGKGLRYDSSNCRSPSAEADFCAMDFESEPTLPEGSDSSFALEGAVLNDAVARFQTAVGSPKVTLVAHSMGGLASRVMIEGYGGGPKVDHLVTIGTPHRGSVWAELLSDPSIDIGVAPIALAVFGGMRPASGAVRSLKPGSVELLLLNSPLYTGLLNSSRHTSIVGVLDPTVAAALVGSWSGYVAARCTLSPFSCAYLQSTLAAVAATFTSGDGIVADFSQDLAIAGLASSVVRIAATHLGEPGAVGTILNAIGLQ